MGSVREGFDAHEWKYRRVIVEEAGGCTRNSAAAKYY